MDVEVVDDQVKSTSPISKMRVLQEGVTDMTAGGSEAVEVETPDESLWAAEL